MMHRKTTCLWLVLPVVLLIPVAVASADVISQSGVTYTYGVAPNASYPDDSFTKLKDGVSITTPDFTKCVGWQSVGTSINLATVNFDLGKAYELDQVQVNYGVYGGANVTGWSAWTVTLYSDFARTNAVYTKSFNSSDLTAADGWNQCNFGDALATGYWGHLNIAPAESAQYVQIVGTSHMAYVGETYEGWGMVAEVQFSQVVPEPSSFALLAAGLFGLVAYAWRKRK